MPIGSATTDKGLVGKHRTAWHFLFANLLRKRGPRWLEVRDEVPLSDEPARLDYLLLRHRPEIPGDDRGQTLRGLWPLLPPTAVAELKTVGRPYRPRNLDRLLGYLHFYFSADDGGNEPIDGAPALPSASGGPPRRPRAVERAQDLAGVLIVPARTPTLDDEVEARGLAWSDRGSGYAELTGGLFRLFVVEVDLVAEEEGDDMLRLFGRAPERTPQARRFLAELIGSKETRMNVEELEGFDEVAKVFLDRLSPEQRLAGLAPEQRLAGLAPEQRLLAMPDEALRALSREYVDTLPEPTRSAIQKRLGR